MVNVIGKSSEAPAPLSDPKFKILREQREILLEELAQAKAKGNMIKVQKLQYQIYQLGSDPDFRAALQADAEDKAYDNVVS